MIMTVTIMVVGILLPFSSIGAAVGLVPLPLSYFPYLIGILTCYCILTQGVKMLYIKKFHSWV
jgi:Mg2+-importing ATPase